MHASHFAFSKNILVRFCIELTRHELETIHEFLLHLVVYLVLTCVCVIVCHEVVIKTKVVFGTKLWQ